MIILNIITITALVIGLVCAGLLAYKFNKDEIDQQYGTIMCILSACLVVIIATFTIRGLVC